MHVLQYFQKQESHSLLFRFEYDPETTKILKMKVFEFDRDNQNAEEIEKDSVSPILYDVTFATAQLLLAKLKVKEEVEEIDEEDKYQD